MFKRLYLWLMLGASTAALIGCGGGNSIDAPTFDPPSCEGADASSDACLPPPPPPNPCDATPQPPECVLDKISITSPAANSVWAQPEMNLTVTFSAGTPAGLALTLNGQDVSSYAVTDDEQATIAGADIESLLVHGNNNFEAKVGTEVEKVTFIYDLEAPHIVVTTAVVVATDSVQQKAGDTLKVSGFVRDVAPIETVTINDIAATVSNGGFVVEIPHSETYRVSATDIHGQSSTLGFAAPQHRLDPLLAMQINNSMLKVIEPIANGIFANFDTSPMVNPSQRIPLDRLEAAITRLDLDKGGEPSIDMHFLPSASEALLIEVVVDMPLVGMGMEVFNAGGANPLLALDLDIASIDVTLQLAVSSDELNQLRLGLGSATPFDVSWGNITINRFDIACTATQCLEIPNRDFINSQLNTPFFRNTLVSMINQNLAPALADILADLEIPNVPVHVPLDVNGDKTRDTQLTMDFVPSLLTTGTQGNALIEMAGSMYIANEDLPAGYKGALGSGYVETGPAPAFASTTDAGKEYDLGIALPSNFLNQAFLSLYQSGLMSSIAAELEPAALGSFGAFFPTADKLRMRMEVGAVPYMQLSHANLAAGKTTGIAMHIDNVTIYMDSRDVGQTEFKTMIGMVADIRSNLELGIDANNYIDLGVDKLVNMDVVSVLPVGLGASGAITAELIESQIGPAVKNMLKTDTLPDMLKKTMEIAISMADESNIPMQLPLELGMITREISVDPSDAYLVIKIDLLDSDEVENATENVPYNISIRKRPPVTPQEPPAP